MSDHNHAQLMLSMAHKDLSAIKNTMNQEAFADEIFGFHAQQAVEKGLKAWLSALGVSYPKIHDIEELLALLADQGADVASYRQLIDLNDFAVQFRYEAFSDFEAAIDRAKTIHSVTALLEDIQRTLSNSAMPSL